MVLLTCWQQIGYMMIIYIAGLQGLPGDVIEAAAVDGANSRQTLFNVTIPLMMPSITVCTFLTVTNGYWETTSLSAELLYSFSETRA